MDRKTIKTILKNSMQKVHDKLTIPATALTLQTIIQQFEHHNQSPPSLSALKEIATELNWEYRILNDEYAKGPALVKLLEPNLDALIAELKRMTEQSYLRIRHLKLNGLRAAFDQYNVTADPEGIISEETWTTIFDELGFIYEHGNQHLITKTLELPANAQEQISEALADLSETYRASSKRTRFEKVKVLVETDLRERLTQKWGQINKFQWATLHNGKLGQVLIQAGFSLDKEWVYRTETTPSLKKPGYIFLPAQIIRDATTKTDQFAKGFPINVPAAICDGTTLVYLELLGPRQAVKANWAAIRGGKEKYIYGMGSIVAKKEDGFVTLKTTLRQCRWDHWCLIHQQASCEKMMPLEHFYVLDRSFGPANFYAQLAKAAPFPVLSHWAEYLWVQGRMNDLITALGGTGLGGWKVFFVKEKWEEIVSRGLKEGKIKIRTS